MDEAPNMISGEYSYTFDDFTVFSHGDHIYFGTTGYPIGQAVVDVLNLDDSMLMELDQLCREFYTATVEMLEKKTDSAISSAQEKLNAVWDVVFTLPVFRDLKMDLELSYHLFQRLRADEEKWNAILQDPSPEHDIVLKMISHVGSFPMRLHQFKFKVQLLTDNYLEPLKRRSASAYAHAFSAFYGEMLAVAAGAEMDFRETSPVELDFVPMLTPDGDDVFLAEKSSFGDLVDFLKMDLYRGLAIGNAPRRCHNCGRYFLLTAGYNTCYCNNIAPGETDKTCRKVGAHNKEAQGKENRTPAQKEYARTYNRLKQRKVRGKISVDEWNAAVSKAQELVEQNGRGELSDEELKRQLDEL